VVERAGIRRVPSGGRCSAVLSAVLLRVLISSRPGCCRHRFQRNDLFYSNRASGRPVLMLPVIPGRWMGPTFGPRSRSWVMAGAAGGDSGQLCSHRGAPPLRRRRCSRDHLHPSSCGWWSMAMWGRRSARRLETLLGAENRHRLRPLNILTTAERHGGGPAPGGKKTPNAVERRLKRGPQAFF